MTAPVWAEKMACGTFISKCCNVGRTKLECMNADGIAFHSMIISGRGQHVLPQANDFEFYDENLSANVPTNLTDGLCCLHKVDFAIVNTLHAKLVNMMGLIYNALSRRLD